MKKLFSILIAIAIVLSVCPAAFATDLPALTFDISATTETATSALTSGTNEIVAETGDIITVYYKISAASATTVSTSQTEIYYDDSFFELVTDSNKVESGSGFSTSVQKRLSGKRYVFFNTINTKSYGAEASSIGSFQLKVIATSGESTVSNTNEKAYKNASDSYKIVSQDLHVSIHEKQPQKFTVKYDAGEGTVSPTSVEVTSGESVVLPTPTRLGYVFSYWTIGGDSTMYSAGKTYTPSSDVTFTAYWTETGNVAYIGDVGYTSLQEAINAAKNGDKIVLVKNTNETITVGKTLSIQIDTTNGTHKPLSAGSNTTVSSTTKDNVVSYEFKYSGSSGGTSDDNDGDDSDDDGDGTEQPVDKSEVIVAVDGCDLADECPIAEFTDATANKWYHAGVHYCLDMNYMNGVGSDKFQPEGSTSRAMIVTILYRMEGSPAVSGDVTFTDVKAGQWFYNAVVWASQNKIVEGYSDAIFNPNGDITREQFAAILYRYANYKGYDVSGRGDLDSFNDSGDISSWAQTAVSWANSVGLITGRDGNVIAPTDGAVRAEAATLIYRFDVNVVK